MKLEKIHQDNISNSILNKQRVKILVVPFTGANSRGMLFHLIINQLYNNPYSTKDKLSLLLNEPIKIKYIINQNSLLEQTSITIKKNVPEYLLKYFTVEVVPTTKVANKVLDEKVDLIIIDETYPEKNSFYKDILHNQKLNANGINLIFIQGCYPQYLAYNMDVILNFKEEELLSKFVLQEKSFENECD